MVGVEHESMSQHVVAGIGAGEVPIGVIREVDVGRFIGHGSVIHDQLIVGGQFVGDGRLKVSRKASLPVGTNERESHANSPGLTNGLALPQLPGKSVFSPAPVDVMLVLLPYNRIKSDRRWVEWSI